MNRKTIQKIIDELDKGEPRLDYIRGILETLLESLPEERDLQAKVVMPKFAPSPMPKKDLDEASLMEAEALALTKKIDTSAIKTE